MNGLEKLTKTQLIEMLMKQGDNLTKLTVNFEDLEKQNFDLRTKISEQGNKLKEQKKHIDLIQQDRAELDKSLITANLTITEFRHRLHVAETLSLALAKTVK